MNREQMLEVVRDRLGGRRIVWAGLRADDAQGLCDLKEFVDNFSLFGASSPHREGRSLALDEMTGRRVDPEVWDVDAHLDDPATIRFRSGILTALAVPSVLVPYRSTEFLSSIQLARRETSKMLGLFSGQQSLFEYKPWVEVAIAGTGISHVPWRYVAQEDRLRLRELDPGEYVIRRSRTSGGEGFTRTSSFEDLIETWPLSTDRIVSVAPFIESCPVNVGATVWIDGVTVHNPSLQLIGVPSCAGREFGHCGNDFVAMKQFPEHVIDGIERSTVAVGDWLRANGYLGTFGVDFLVTPEQILFAEINPRFQGSTSLSSRIDRELGLPCLLLEHLAAWLGVRRPDGPRLRERVATAPEMSSVVVHWTGGEPRRVDATDLVQRVEAAYPDVAADVTASPHVINDPGSTVVRLVVPQSVTRTGFDLDAKMTQAIDDWRARQSIRLDPRTALGAIPTEA